VLWNRLPLYFNRAIQVATENISVWELAHHLALWPSVYFYLYVKRYPWIILLVIYFSSITTFCPHCCVRVPVCAKTWQCFRSANLSLESLIRGLFGYIFSFKIKVGVYEKLTKTWRLFYETFGLCCRVAGVTCIFMNECHMHGCYEYAVTQCILWQNVDGKESVYRRIHFCLRVNSSSCTVTVCLFLFVR